MKKIIILLILSFGFFLVLNLSAPLRIQGDGVFYYSWLRSALWDRDFDFKNELENFRHYDIGSDWFLTNHKTTALGKAPNPYAFGSALLWLPLILVAHLITWLSRFLGGNLPADGYSYFYVLAVNFATWLFGSIALVINFKNLKLFFKQKVAWLTLLLLFLATPWFYYQFFEPAMAHIGSLFLISVLLVYLIKIRQKQKINYWFLAILVFLTVATRWQNVLFLLTFLPGLWLGRKDLKQTLKIILALVAPVIVFVLIQGLVWFLLYGRYFLVPQGYRFVRLEFHGLYTLLSVNHGLLLWSPVLILALIGWVFLLKKSKFWALVALLAFLPQWLINSSLNDLGGGDAFGGRRFIETLPFLALALAAFGERFQKSFKLIWLVALVLIFWNFILLENYRLNLIPHAGEFDFFGHNYLQVVGRDFNHFILRK